MPHYVLELVSEQLASRSLTRYAPCSEGPLAFILLFSRNK